MATNRVTIDGYGQLEINNCAFRRDGRIEAQCKANMTDFAGMFLENGMLFAIDNVAREILAPKNDNLPIGINYSAEHFVGDEFALKLFKLKPENDFLPRIGLLAVGDKFTTNCLCYDTTEIASDKAFWTAVGANEATPLWGGIDGSCAIKVTATKPAKGPVLRVIAKTTMPDGQLALKFQVYKA